MEKVILGKKSKNAFFQRFAALLLLVCVCVSMLSSCTVLSREEEKARLANRIEAVSVNSCETITECLARWKFPKGYNLQKLQDVEETMLYGYYKSLDMRGMAKAAAECFLLLYYDEMDFSDSEAYTDALIRCMVLALGDDYAIYRTAEEYAAYHQSMSGTYGGIGMTVRKNFETGIIMVTRLISDSPALKAGVQIGDILYSVEGMIVTKENMEEAFANMQGDVGESVRFELLRGEEVIPFEIVRENLENMTVSYTLSEDKIAYISISSFQENTAEHFIKYVNEAEAAGAVGFIFDVRDNPGGYLSSVLYAIEYLVPEGTELCSYGKAGGSPTAYVSSDAHVLSVPCVVLCNDATASAGELFTAAIRDYNNWGLLNATVVGTSEATYGKGIMQSSYSIANGFKADGKPNYDGSKLTMTSAYYYPPCRVNYHEKGVVPDVVCEEEKALDVARQELLDLIENNKT